MIGYLTIEINHRVIARKSFHVDGTTGEGHAAEIFRALANDTRVAILRYLGDRVVAVNQIAKDMGLPSSTATMHITVLERAGLIHTELRPASRGLQKVCARTYDELVFDLPRGLSTTPAMRSISRCRSVASPTSPLSRRAVWSVRPD